MTLTGEIWMTLDTERVAGQTRRARGGLDMGEPVVQDAGEHREPRVAQ